MWFANTFSLYTGPVPKILLTTSVTIKLVVVHTNNTLQKL